MNPSTKSCCILNVSHDPAVRRAISSTLAEAGFAVTEAEDPGKALQEIENRLPDLVLLDVDMPGADGHKLCVQIRQQPRAARLPVVFLSASRKDAHFKACGPSNGADGYLVWPANQDVLAGSIQAVLRRREAEARLSQSEEGFRTTFDQVTVGLGFLTLDLQWTWVNQRLCQIFGFPQEELSQRSSLEILSPADAQRLLECTRQILAGQAECSALEQRCRRKDGSEFWASWAVSLARKPDGAPKHFVVVVDDISIRKWTEENLLLIRAGIESSSEAIAIADPEGRHVYHNIAFTRMFGYRVEELPETLAPIVLYADRAVGRAVLETKMHGQPWRGEVDMVARDGRRFPVELRADAIRDEQGRIVGLIRVHTDITERKHLERQFRQAQKMEAVGQLAGGVAHDFNNMLAVIRGNAELLPMYAGQLSAEANECMNNIVAASEKAARLTRQLLVFSRKEVMQSQPVDLNDLVRNLTKMFGRTIREDIRLDYSYADQLPFVQADPGMLEQVLLNLVVNARDAMPQGGHLQISTETTSVGAARAQANPEARAGEFVCLSVSDTGTGIAPEHLPRIFEPFFTTKPSDKGTGLGLAMVYGAVKQHQGWVEVASRVGKGTAFKIFLPAISPEVSRSFQKRTN